MAHVDWDSGLEQSQWATTLLREADPFTYFNPFKGKPGDKNAIIHVETTMETKPGKDVTFGLIMYDDEEGVLNNEVLEGQESPIDSHSQTVTLKRRRKAHRDEGEFEDQKFALKFRKEARAQLAMWIADILDKDCVVPLKASPTRTLRDDAAESFEINTSQATLKANLVDGDKISPAGISAAKRLAIKPAGSSEVRIRAVNVKGKKYFVMFLHPDSAYDWKRNAEAAQAHRDALARGEDNPIFSGALGIWDGVVLQEHDKLDSWDDGGGGSIHYTQNIFCGAQALLMARCKRPSWREKTFDYGDQVGIAAKMIYGVDKTVFDSEDFGCMSVFSTATSFAAT